MKREAAARFAFLMGIPIIGGAFVWKLREVAFGSLNGSEQIALLAGFVAAAIAGCPRDQAGYCAICRATAPTLRSYRIGLAIVAAAILLIR